MLNHFSCVWPFVTPWTVACQAPLSMRFSRQEYWSGLPWLPPGDLPDPGIEPASLLPPTLVEGSLAPVGKPPSSAKEYYSVQFSSVTQSCPTLCDPMNHSTPGLPVHHQLLEFTQTHVRRVSDAIQPSHPLSSPFPPAPNPSQPQSLFQWVNSVQNCGWWVWGGGEPWHSSRNVTREGYKGLGESPPKAKTQSWCPARI